MKNCFVVAAAVLLSACSDAPPVVKPSEKAPEPLTGRQAFYKTYPPARLWSADAQPLRVRSIDLTELKGDKGTAGAWEVTYTSESKGRSRIFTWSGVEAAGNIHQGVFGTQEESWRAGAAEKPFVIQAFKIDTPDALQTAISHSDAYFNKVGTKPHPKFELEFTANFPDPVWRVYWGDSVSTAEWNVFVDATTGEYKGR